MRIVWEKLREWGAVISFLVVILVVSLWTVNDNQTQRDIQVRQAQIIKALAEENNDAILANGDFQTCVWLAIVKPHVIGHQARSVRAINNCANKYLEGR